MESVTLKKAITKKYKLEESEFEYFVLNKTLYFRVRLFRPIIRFFNSQFLFNEKRLIEQLANTTSLREVHEEIDFYQHKFVTGFLLKEALRIRISGMKVIRLARDAFIELEMTGSSTKG